MLLSRMAQGDFEAILTIEPDLSQGEARGLLRVWAAACDDAYLPRYQWVVMVARPDLMAREPALVRAVLRASARADRYLVDHPDEWARFLERTHGVSADAAGRAVARERPHVARDCAVDMEGLQEAIELQRTLGAFTQPLRAADIADLRFLPERAATADAGV
jgi:ABC-type nitrate/sulfonate/bicarbonate transport system substrate-binding protein